MSTLKCTEILVKMPKKIISREGKEITVFIFQICYYDLQACAERKVDPVFSPKLQQFKCWKFSKKCQQIVTQKREEAFICEMTKKDLSIYCL